MILFILFLLGAIVGSFLNVLILRLPQARKVNGRSECPHCKHQLSAIDLVPVLSYLFMRGHCRYCGYKISVRYITIELITATLFGVVAMVFIPRDIVSTLELARALFIASVFVIVFAIDLEKFLILDRVVFPATAIILLLNVLSDLIKQQPLLDLTSATTGGLIMAALFFSVFFFVWFVSKGRWIGFGDVKLMIFLGLALGWPQTLTALFIAFVSGGLIGSFLLLSGRKQLQSKLPLGTFLSVGAIAALLWGDSLLNWYWHLLGFTG